MELFPAYLHGEEPDEDGAAGVDGSSGGTTQALGHAQPKEVEESNAHNAADCGCLCQTGNCTLSWCCRDPGVSLYASTCIGSTAVFCSMSSTGLSSNKDIEVCKPKLDTSGCVLT